MLPLETRNINETISTTTFYDVDINDNDVDDKDVDDNDVDINGLK